MPATADDTQVLWGQVLKTKPAGTLGRSNRGARRTSLFTTYVLGEEVGGGGEEWGGREGEEMGEASKGATPGKRVGSTGES